MCWQAGLHPAAIHRNPALRSYAVLSLGITLPCNSSRHAGPLTTQFNDTELTAAVIAGYDNIPDPRAKFLLQELVKSLHDYVFVEGDTYLDSDVVFGVKDKLVSTIEKCNEPSVPDGRPAGGPWHLMICNFRMKPGIGHAPQPMMPETEDA